MKNVFENWDAHHAHLFGKHTIRLKHNLLESGLFTPNALAGLIDRYPDDLYTLSTMGSDPKNPVWREGRLGGLPGSSVIDAVRSGRIWLNLRRVQDVDQRYAFLLGRMFNELEQRVPELRTFRQNLGILISSPNAQVFYHADIPGQSLWQIAGRKRVFIYPNSEPFLKPEWMEKMILGETEEDIPYETWFEDYAEIYDLEPGEMLHWPLNGPHRVVNQDCMNISVTTEHFTNDIRRSYAIHYANGVLRGSIGMCPKSQSTRGLSAYGKMALAFSHKSLKLNKSKQLVRKFDFIPDPAAPNGYVDRPPGAA